MKLALTEAVRGLEAMCKGTGGGRSCATALSLLGIGSKLAFGVNSALVQLACTSLAYTHTSEDDSLIFKKTINY